MGAPLCGAEDLVGQVPLCCGGKIYSRLFSLFCAIEQEFTSYLQKHDEVLTELEKATKRLKKLEMVYKEFELQKVCYLPLNTFLLKPIQRLMHYKLILGRLCKHYTAEHRDFADCRSEWALSCAGQGVELHGSYPVGDSKLCSCMFGVHSPFLLSRPLSFSHATVRSAQIIWFRSLKAKLPNAFSDLNIQERNYSTSSRKESGGSLVQVVLRLCWNIDFVFLYSFWYLVLPVSCRALVQGSEVLCTG